MEMGALSRQIWDYKCCSICGSFWVYMLNRTQKKAESSFFLRLLLLLRVVIAIVVGLLITLLRLDPLLFQRFMDLHQKQLAHSI